MGERVLGRPHGRAAGVRGDRCAHYRAEAAATEHGRRDRGRAAPVAELHAVAIGDRGRAAGGVARADVPVVRLADTGAHGPGALGEHNRVPGFGGNAGRRDARGGVWPDRRPVRA